MGTGGGLIADEGVILRVRDWQTADKYAVCFTKEHGKLRFVAYGARYGKSTKGRLLQPFARLRLEVTAGQKLDRLAACELAELPCAYDMKQMAYGAVIAELTAVLTEDHAPQPELYELLVLALAALRQRNPRLLTLAYALQLLRLAGVAPQLCACTACGRMLDAAEDCFFDAAAGGAVCRECGGAGRDTDALGAGTRRLMQTLDALDLAKPKPFSVRGGELMELERVLYKFILCQTEKPLNSLSFLSQLGL